ncbi:YXWGXW repeat-containing protein [Paraherbaspirillum soli]|uniref:YXWGXW repeat-containing protein n=1 Tax=Paraherbaspirillum soli TaxID=631222 RepID=A0ABW0MER7_9BURK
MKHIFCAAALVAISAIAWIPAQAHANVDVNIIVNSEPPPPRYELVPPPRHGYVWAPGYWSWDGRHHVWRQGHWERFRSGQYYQRPGWVRRPNGWQFEHGGWYRSRDRYDHHGHHGHRDGYHCPPGQAKKGNC